jgi:uncharacterized protein YbjT (DUF2867 family)
MKILVIGANGQVGRKLIRHLVKQDMPVRAMVRKSQQITFIQELGAEVVLHDLEEDFSEAYIGIECIIFTAGSGSKTGPDKTIDIDQKAAIKSIGLAKKHGIKHYVMVSAQGAREPEKESKIQHYYKAKYLADEYLLQSGINYTIFRPGRLIDAPCNQKVDLSAGHLNRGVTNRENLAAAIAHAVGKENTMNKIIEITDGDTPIIQAFTQI